MDYSKLTLGPCTTSHCGSCHVCVQTVRDAFYAAQGRKAPKIAGLDNWTLEQEAAFQAFLRHYAAAGDPVPELLVRKFRKGFRDRRYTPTEIQNHRGLLPQKS